MWTAEEEMRSLGGYSSYSVYAYKLVVGGILFLGCASVRDHIQKVVEHDIYKTIVGIRQIYNLPDKNGLDFEVKRSKFKLTVRPNMVI